MSNPIERLRENVQRLLSSSTTMGSLAPTEIWAALNAAEDAIRALDARVAALEERGRRDEARALCEGLDLAAAGDAGESECERVMREALGRICDCLVNPHCIGCAADAQSALDRVAAIKAAR